LAHYNGTAWDYPDSLEPFKGYGYWSEKDTVLIIPVKEANINSRKTLAKGSGEGEWNIQIQARCGEYNDLYNFAGMKLNARDQFDRTDRMEPPVPGKGISLYFKQKDDLSNQIKLTSDYRSPKDDLFLYDFEFKCDFSDKTLLNFVANKLPDDYDWIVISKEGNVILPKGEISSNRKSKSYQLIVGNRSALNEVEKDFKPVPKTFRVSQNYPNPFNPVTKITIELPKEVYIHIDIFDILGRKVKTLVNGKLIEEGYHQFEWDGTNTSGHSVATGIYFLNFRSPDYTKTIKMILSR
jgi:hypothetical protein